MPLNKALGNSNAVILCTQCLDVLLNERPHTWILPEVLKQMTWPILPLAVNTNHM